MPRLLARLALAAPLLALAPLAPLPAAAQGVSGPYLAAQIAAQRGDILEAARYYGEAVAKDGDNRVLLERAIVHQVAAGRVGTAVALSRKLHEMVPDHRFAILVLASDALRRGDAEAARALMAELDGPLNVFDVAPMLVDAWAAWGTGNTESARETLGRIEELEERLGPAVVILVGHHLGLMAAAEGRDEDAVASFERAAEASGTPSVRLTRYHSAALARLGRTEEALKLLEDRLSTIVGDERLELLAERIEAGDAPDVRITEVASGAAQALFDFAGMIVGIDERTVPIAAARLATWMEPDLVEATLLIAELLASSGQHELAIDAYAEVPDDAPEAMEAMLGRATSLEESEQLDAGLALLEEVRSRFPQEFTAHNALGDMLRRNERFAEASKAYDRAVDLIDPQAERFWWLWYQRGITLEQSDQWDRAEADFRKALELNPDQPLVLNYLGYSLVELGRNLEEAEKMIEKAVEQRPDDGYIVDSLGWVQFRLGEFDKAVENLNKAVELMPADSILNDHLGDALWMVGRQIEARFQWKRALSFDPEEEDAERIRRKLEVGLDQVLEEDAAEGKPTIITRDEARDAEGDDG